MNTDMPSKQLLAQVRGTLIAQGVSFNKRCATRAVDRVWASDALIGKRNSEAKALRTRIIREGLPDVS